MPTIPTFARTGPNVGGTIQLKIQPASDDSGSYVPVVSLDAESGITIGSVSLSEPIPAGTNSIGLVGPSGSEGIDYSINAPSLSGLTLLATIPATASRLGYFIQSQDANGLTIVMDDQVGAQTPTIIILAGAATTGGQGASLSMSGIPHVGRIRIYSSSSNTQMAARTW